MSKEDHVVLPESVRLENALNIWIRDLREQELAKVKAGGRLSVPALAYEEVLKLREILGRFMQDRQRRIQRRWNRRSYRRARDLLLARQDAYILREFWTPTELPAGSAPISAETSQAAANVALEEELGLRRRKGETIREFKARVHRQNQLAREFQDLNVFKP